MKNLAAYAPTFSTLASARAAAAHWTVESRRLHRVYVVDGVAVVGVIGFGPKLRRAFPNSNIVTEG